MRLGGRLRLRVGGSVGEEVREGIKVRGSGSERESERE